MNLSKQKFIVFRVGWMEYYQGMQGDTIQSTAKFVVSEEYGYEMYNFLLYDGYLYGFVQPSGKGNFTQRIINIERLGADKKADSVDNVLVAWVAPRKGGGVFLVGWYNNATVYKYYQEPPQKSARIFKDVKIGYYAKARQNDSVLLPVKERTLLVPKSKKKTGGLGQSLVWFADTHKVNDIFFREKLLEFIDFYSHQTVESDFNDSQIFTSSRFAEGTPYKALSTAYERNKKAREICINHYGLKCKVCDFDFLRFYGEIGEGYIHVHHIQPLSEMGKAREIDPIQDLLPVCPNCHAMIHRRTPPYTIDEMKAFIHKNSG
jgi:5-methylcytosine-specific restriction protein A